MRTTIDLDDDILRAGKSLARQRAKSLGKVISELARIGMADRLACRMRNMDFRVFTVDPGTSPITLEDVNRSEDEA